LTDVTQCRAGVLVGERRAAFRTVRMDWKEIESFEEVLDLGLETPAGARTRASATVAALRAAEQGAILAATVARRQPDLN
jgi:hypothetical protein